jgi:hypothetical protein
MCVFVSRKSKKETHMPSLSSWIGTHRFFAVCLLAASLALLAGCGSAPAQGQNAPSCGQITMSTNPQYQYVANFDGLRPRQVEQCFVLAYQKCQTASLGVTSHGVDTGTTSTYTIKPQGTTCQIIDSAAPYGVGIHTPQPTITTCHGLTENKDFLVITGCNGNNLMFPRAEDCGAVYSQNTADKNQQAETCFTQDYQQCYAAALEYSPANAPTDEFQLSDACKLTLIVGGNQPGTACASLTQQTDGLLFQGCGDRGNMLVPAKP